MTEPKQYTEIIEPQPKQWEFLLSCADIVGYGGSAGAGKTYSMILELLRHISNGGFNGVTFRRTSPEITNPEGLWDESGKIYPCLGGNPIKSKLKWEFPSGSTIRFSHMENEDDKNKWQGSALTFIGWEELTHFTRSQFMYMLSRNRSTCGIRPYIRFTCNPDADSWVAELIAWWIGEDGYIIKERSGVIRYFTVMNDEFIWGNTVQDVIDKTNGERKVHEIKSFTFISANLYDNQKLLKANPEYEGNLKALSHVEQERLLKGNWKIRKSSGLYFKDEYFQKIHITALPKSMRIVNSWDLASTTDAENNQSARTARVKMGKCNETNRIYIIYAEAFRKDNFGVEKAILETARIEGYNCEITFPQDPGQAGKAQARQLAAKLAGYQVAARRPEGDKEYRARGLSAQAGAGNVFIVEGEWNSEYIREMVNFPVSSLKDFVDASSDAFNHLCNPSTEWAFYEKDSNESFLD